MYKSILVGTDGSDTAKVAVERAAELARVLGAQLDIVSAYEPVSQTRLREELQDAPADVEWAINPREDVNGVLNDAAEQAKVAEVVEESITTFAREGSPADAIIDVAEERGSDLIVIGNKGMSGAKRFLLGSVPNKVSHHAPCSVLVVRTV